MIFPRWANKVVPILIVCAIGGLCTVVFVVWYWGSPENLDVGYTPTQPIPYSHRLHVSELGIDCRFCHYNVEYSKAATVPATEVCMKCHLIIKTDSPHIQKLKASFDNNKPMNWVKVHNTPNYAYFDHSRHVNSGVSCVSCHGRIDMMEVVQQKKPLSMSWCLDCHRDPAPHIRPKKFLTQLDWKVDNPREIGEKIMKELNLAPRENCNTCHR